MVVAGTRRAIKELVDGTLRVQIDIEPKDKKEFLDLFPVIDTPVALAPLRLDAPMSMTHEPKGWGDLGPLAQSAVMICKEGRFQDYVAYVEGIAPGYVDELGAANYVRTKCGVSSRKELDTADGAREHFGALMADYREWLKRK